jgi:hypothetical protein
LLLTRLGSFARLPRGERRLAWRAMVLLALTRARLRFIPFDRVRAMSPPRAAPSATPSADTPKAVRRAVLRAVRALPGSSCLAQSLVAERLLHERGHDAKFSVGVARDARTSVTRAALDAHAWVESGGVLVTGDDPHDRYQVLATFGPE